MPRWQRLKLLPRPSSLVYVIVQENVLGPPRTSGGPVFLLLLYENLLQDTLFL